GAARANRVDLGRPLVDPRVHDRFVIGCERGPRLLAAAVHQPRHSVGVVTGDPTMADSPRKTDRHRHCRGGPAFGREDHYPESPSSISVLLDTLKPLKLLERQMFSNFHRNLRVRDDCDIMMGSLGKRNRMRATLDWNAYYSLKSQPPVTL